MSHHSLFGSRSACRLLHNFPHAPLHPFRMGIVTISTRYIRICFVIAQSANLPRNNSILCENTRIKMTVLRYILFFQTTL